MVSNMGFNLLAIPFSYVGLAIASAMSATLNAYLLYHGLSKAGVYQVSKTTWTFALRLLAAALGMGAFIWYYSPSLNEWVSMSLFNRVHWLSWLLIGAALSYFILLALFGVRKHHFRH